MESHTLNEPLVFKPRPSTGQLWLFGIGIAMLVLILGPSLPTVLSVPEALPSLLIGLVVGLVLGGAFIVMGLWVPTMRYELDSRYLTLRCGPLLNYRIPLAGIQGIRRRNLALSLWSSMRFPGIAMWDVRYADEGRVYMCATSALTGILLIETEKEKYGITPADEEAFVAALKARMPA